MEKEYFLREAFYIKNFLQEEEIEMLMKEISMATEDDWWYGSREYAKTHDYAIGWSDRNLVPKNEKILKNIDNKCSNLFENKYKTAGIHAIHRMYPGSSLIMHHDSGGPTADLVNAIVIYLNDDFNGGELVYPKDNYILKPEKGMLVSHPGTEDYWHGVNEVLPGNTRYSLVNYIIS